MKIIERYMKYIVMNRFVCSRIYNSN